MSRHRDVISVPLFTRNAVLRQRLGRGDPENPPKKPTLTVKSFHFLSHEHLWFSVTECGWKTNAASVRLPRFGSQLAPVACEGHRTLRPLLCDLICWLLVSFLLFRRPHFINTINILQSARLKKGQKRWMLSVVALTWNPPISNVWRHLEAPRVGTLIRPTAPSVVYKIRWKNELLIFSHHKEISFFFFPCTFHGPPLHRKAQWGYAIWDSNCLVPNALLSLAWGGALLFWVFCFAFWLYQKPGIKFTGGSLCTMPIKWESQALGCGGSSLQNSSVCIVLPLQLCFRLEPCFNGCFAPSNCDW